MRIVRLNGRLLVNLDYNSNMSDFQFHLRPAEPTDAAIICRNRNRDYIHLHTPELYSEYQTRLWLENLPKSSKRFLVVSDKDFTFTRNNLEYTWHKDSLAGIVRIDQIDEIYRTCYVGLDIFDHFRGAGLSRPIYQKILSYLFDDLNMRVLYLEVLASNAKAIHVYEKIGFKFCGKFPGKIVRGGAAIDSLIYYYEQKRTSDG